MQVRLQAYCNIGIFSFQHEPIVKCLRQRLSNLFFSPLGPFLRKIKKHCCKQNQGGETTTTAIVPSYGRHSNQGPKSPELCSNSKWTRCLLPYSWGTQLLPDINYNCQNHTQRIFLCFWPKRRLKESLPVKDFQAGLAKTMYQLSQSKSNPNLFSLGHYCRSGPCSYNYIARRDSIICLKEWSMY